RASVRYPRVVITSVAERAASTYTGPSEAGAPAAWHERQSLHHSNASAIAVGFGRKGRDVLRSRHDIMRAETRSGRNRIGRPGLANQCVILVGGTGARPNERTKTTPMPLMEVGGVP